MCNESGSLISWYKITQGLVVGVLIFRFFKNSGFSFSLTNCLTKVKELNVSHYLTIVGMSIVSFKPFSGVLVLYEIQIASFWI